MATYIKNFSDISINDIALVGGKNASLGEMYSQLQTKGIFVPDGFAVTADAYREFIAANNLQGKLNQVLQKLDKSAFTNLNETGNEARELITHAVFPPNIAAEIAQAYNDLKQRSGKTNSFSVAVRSSATAEDLPTASFAGQLESFLNISGEEQLVNIIQRCFTSLFTDRVIKYREDKGFGNIDVAVSVGVQVMVRADLGSSGVAFTLDPDSGFDKVIVINSIYGLGENIVQGRSTPDEFVLFKPHIYSEFYPIIQKKTGRKEWTMVYTQPGNAAESTANIETPADKQNTFSITENDVLQLGKWCLEIEKHYSKPMDIEWAKDGATGELFIIQARPETVHAGGKDHAIVKTYTIKNKGKKLAEGIALGEKIASGKARILRSPAESHLLQPGEVLVTDITNPDWDPIMKRAAGIITNKGGRTSHAAIVARELGTVAIVGTNNATENIHDGQEITLSCAEGKTGFVYEGKAEWETKEFNMANISMPHTAPMFILGDPSQAFTLSFYPNKGVGLVRMEFLITHHIKVHPLALTRFGQLKDEKARQEITEITALYTDKNEYFIDKLSQGIATIAAAFYPNDVIVRMSDFKSNEYANLLGGKQFEPEEENPMLGFRGASRYYSPLYKDGFELECRAMKKVREVMGFENVKLMIPFCRTVEEGKNVIEVMKEFGLEQGKNGLEIYVMVEIPSNVLMAEAFADVFDGFSIGSNDLTQLTLGLDRDSTLVSPLFNEKNPAVMNLIASAIKTAKAKGIKIGLCGQAPSDMPEFAQFLVEQGIDSISFNPDALLKGVENMVKAEENISKNPALKRSNLPAEKQAI
ncbi:MAG: phosphoenolpyruvate synthase [Bacteroidia bacterium]